MHTPIILPDQSPHSHHYDFGHDVYFPKRFEHNVEPFDPFTSMPQRTGDQVFIIIAIFVFAIFVGACCFHCCCVWIKGRKQRTLPSPVVVTSATHTAPGGYPVTTLPASNYSTTAYAAPYPAQTTGPNITVQMPMPMPMPAAQQAMPGMQQPQGAPYPPMQQYPGAGAANMNPPTYDMAMANPGPTVAPAGYEKQMPYNPNY